MIAGNRQDPEDAIPVQVGTVIGEPRNREPTNRNVARYARHDPANLRPAGNLLKRTPNGITELGTKSGPRTSCHGSPTDSPRITRLASRSISRAHAASTSAGKWSVLERVEALGRT